jgi:phosphatidylinositol alpha-1,6-mannosyltransferase
MHIAVLTKSFPPPADDGTAIFVQHVCDEMVRQGHQVQVLTPWWGKEAVEQDRKRPYRVVRSWKLPRLSFAALNAYLLFHVFRFRPDLVFLGHAVSTSALSVVWLSKWFSIPYVVLIHGSDLSYSVSTRLDRWALDRVLSNAALLLPNSSFTMAKLRRRGYGAQGMQILHPGVDDTLFRPGDGSAVRECYGLKGKQVCLTVGRVVARKGQERVLKALPQVLDRVPDVVYLIAGRAGEERLKGLVEELDLSDYVRFVGYVDQKELPAFYNACDLFVMPSYSTEADIESFGIVYSEAAACGVPVIGGREGGVPEAVLDGETGLLVDPYDVSELAEVMVRLLTDKELARRLGANGRRRVERELSWEKVGQRVDRLLRMVLGRRGSRR